MSNTSCYRRGFKYSPVARKKFTDQQQDMLSEIFNKNPYPDRSVRLMISSKTGLDTEQIRVWFQNKRARVRFSLQKETTGSSPVKAVGTSVNRDDKGDAETGHMVNIAPSDMRRCNNVTDILKYCQEALSGWPEISTLGNLYSCEVAKDSSETFEDKRLAEAVQNLLEA